MSRKLLRASAAAAQQFGRDSSKIPCPKKDLQKSEPENPGKVSETKFRSNIKFKEPSAFAKAQAKRSSNPWVTAFPPRDFTLYKPSDKLNRTYQRTWRECELHQHKHKLSKSRPITDKAKGRLTTTCSLQSDLSPGLGKCSRKVASPCPRVNLPYCKEANLEGCFLVSRPSGSVKRRTKYPSYSECLKDPLPDLHPSECFCLKTPPMCAVWNYNRMKKS